MFEVQMIKKYCSEYFIKEIIEDITSLGGMAVYCTITLFSLFVDYAVGIKLTLMLLLSYLVTAIIKSFYKKERPKEESYKNIVEKLHSRSFPSLHAMRATMLGITFAKILNERLAIILSVLLILIVGWTRIMLKKHYWTDVFGGIIFGIIIVLTVNCLL